MVVVVLVLVLALALCTKAVDPCQQRAYRLARPIVRRETGGVAHLEHGKLLDEESAQLMAEKGVYLAPTLATYAALVRVGPDLGWSAAMLEKTARIMDRGMETICIARKAGVKIAVGSDLLGQMHPFQYDELVLRQAAVSPAEVLRSATYVNAELMNQSGCLGIVADGAHADLLVMDGHPVSDLSAFRDEENILMVLTAGEPVVDRLTDAPMPVVNNDNSFIV